jgi:hypothetical protein
MVQLQYRHTTVKKVNTKCFNSELRLQQPSVLLWPSDTRTATLVTIAKWSLVMRWHFICRDEWTKQFADLGKWTSPLSRLTSEQQYRKCSNVPEITGPHTHGISSEGSLRRIPMSHSSTAAQDAEHRGLCRHCLRYSPNSVTAGRMSVRHCLGHSRNLHRNLLGFRNTLWADISDGLLSLDCTLNVLWVIQDENMTLCILVSLTTQLNSRLRKRVHKKNNFNVFYLALGPS